MARVKRLGGGGICTLKYRYRAYAFIIPWPLEIHGRGCRGHLWCGVDALIEGLGNQVPENERGRGIVPQNPNIERAGSISVDNVKLPAGRAEPTYGVR